MEVEIKEEGNYSGLDSKMELESFPNEKPVSFKNFSSFHGFLRLYSKLSQIQMTFFLKILHEN